MAKAFVEILKTCFTFVDRCVRCFYDYKLKNAINFVLGTFCLTTFNFFIGGNSDGEIPQRQFFGWFCKNHRTGSGAAKKRGGGWSLNLNYPTAVLPLKLAV